MNEFFLYTDGGCHGNPGPGAWAWRLVDRGGKIISESSGFSAHTTNNRMELTAVIEGLRYIRHRGISIVVITDSQYVRQGITSWITKWRTNGWKTTAKKPVKKRRTLDGAGRTELGGRSDVAVGKRPRRRYAQRRV